MQKLDQHEKLPEDDKSLLNDAKDIMDEVLARMTETSKKYGSAYTLADITAELNAELLDIVGWPLLEVVRMRRVMKGRLEKLNDEYLKKFLAYHDDAYLGKLRRVIDIELARRQHHVVK